MRALTLVLAVSLASAASAMAAEQHVTVAGLSVTVWSSERPLGA